MMKCAFALTAVAACLLPAVAAPSDEDLVRQMELEITIRDLAKATRAEAHRRAQEAIKKTSLWRRLQEANAAVTPDPECQRATDAYTEREVETTATYFKESMALLKKMAAACADHTERSRSKEYRELKKKALLLREEVFQIQDKFQRKIYAQEMIKKLKALAVEITRDVLEQVERSYTYREA